MKIISFIISVIENNYLLSRSAQCYCTKALISKFVASYDPLKFSCYHLL